MGGSTPSRIRRWEVGTGLLMVGVLACVHWSVLHRAGALWRDECSSVNLASSPSFAVMLRNLYWDSFPVLWCSTLRGWIALGGGASDFSLRLLGAIVGMSIVAVLWWNARRFGSGVPLVSMLVLGFSPTTFRYGDGVRGYGLGALLMLVMLGAIWSLVRDPSRRRIAAAGVASLLAVQSIFSNAPMMLGICVGGAAVCLRRRDWRTIRAMVAIGLLAFVSMLPYLPVVAIHNEYSMMLQMEVDASWMSLRLSEALGAGGAHMVWVWIALVVISILTCGWNLMKRGTVAREKDLALFAAVVLVAGTVAAAGYIHALSVRTQPWYYLPIMALAAVLFDAAVEMLVGKSAAGRIARLVAVVILALSMWPGVSRSLLPRCTNVDILAAELETLSAEGDEIVVHPWYAGVTFARYFDGPASWMTVPDFGPTRSQPYRELRWRMTQKQPIRKELERVERALRTGHRVWLAGGLLFFPSDEEAIPLPPAPSQAAGWEEPAYTGNWSQQVGYLLQKHALKLEPVLRQPDGPVLDYENLSELLVAEGWKP